MQQYENRVCRCVYKSQARYFVNGKALTSISGLQHIILLKINNFISELVFLEEYHKLVQTQTTSKCILRSYFVFEIVQSKFNFLGLKQSLTILILCLFNLQYHLMSNKNSECREFQHHNFTAYQKQPTFTTTSAAKRKKIVDQKNISEDDQFEPEYHTMKKLKLPINRKRLSKGNWILRENQIYLAFLINNKTSFINEATRRQERVFCKLSELLNKKRTPDQCRSHHQKLISNLNNSIEDLIVKIEKKIENKQVRKTNSLCKIQEKQITPMKIQQQIHKETGLPNCKSLNQLHHGGKEREVERVIERDFYKLSLLSKGRTILVQINQQSMRNY